MDDFKNFMNGKPVPDNAVLVTFDDSYKSIYEYAHPILKELGIPAVNFIITQDLTQPFSGKLPSLTEQDVKEMSENQMDIQCHSDRLHRKSNNSEPMLTTRIDENGNPETEEAYASRITNDTQKCIAKLNRITSTNIDSYAYPFGSYNKASIDLIRKAGIKYAFTTASEIATRNDDPLQIPRISAGNPAITPWNLHNAILKRSIDLYQTFDYVPLRETVNQIGGIVIRDNQGNINVYLKDNHWIFTPDKLTVLKNNQPFLNLSKPIKTQNRKTYILLNDLKNILEIQIFYSSNKQSFLSRSTPSIEQTGASP